MSQYQSDFLNIMAERGFLHQLTHAKELDAAMASGAVTAYIGFDCTAPSLHVGSLMQIMVLRWLQKTGHKPIVLLGGGTTKVGDPSGKDESRKILTENDIQRNLTGIKRTLENFIHFGSSPRDAQLVNNDEWLSSLNYIQFLRDYGKHFSVNRMLSQDSVKLRLEREQNLSFLEFNYMVLQAYDFVELNKRYGCTLQIGGSDQWGNIVMGMELGRKLHHSNSFAPLDITTLSNAKTLEMQPMIHSSHSDPKAYAPTTFTNAMQSKNTEFFGMTTPLLATASGAKMGKTADGAVWLSEDSVSPYHYWQYWRNVEDADVGRFLRLFTELPLKEIEKLEALKGAEINEAKKVLATEATALAHGARAAKAAEETARKTFEEGATAETLPSITLESAAIGKGIPAYELFRLSGLVPSGSEAKRLIRGNGAKMNDQKISDENELIPAAMFEKPVKLTAGKKRHMLVVVK
jgi:tyrosyl-tRNA synthetase